MQVTSVSAGTCEFERCVTCCASVSVSVMGATPMTPATIPLPAASNPVITFPRNTPDAVLVAWRTSQRYGTEVDTGADEFSIVGHVFTNNRLGSHVVAPVLSPSRVYQCNAA